jgi:hypothetical protein
VQVKVTIGERELRRGRPHDPGRCPVAHAVNAVLDGGWCVGYCWVWQGRGEDYPLFARRRVRTPPVLRDYLQRYDRGMDVGRRLTFFLNVNPSWLKDVA